jgi:hypothetical protein
MYDHALQCLPASQRSSARAYIQEVSETKQYYQIQ